MIVCVHHWDAFTNQPGHPRRIQQGYAVPKGVDHALPSTDESDVLRFRDLDGITAEVSAV